jgi:hypothetical protein
MALPEQLRDRATHRVPDRDEGPERHCACQGCDVVRCSFEGELMPGLRCISYDSA